MSAEPRKAIALSQSEQAALVLCEAEIEEGKAAFIAVGNALTRIKAEKLYRGTHGTFEAYCQDRWSFSRQYANSICRAAEVVANLEMETPGFQKPSTEKQARPLTKLPRAEQSHAWADAVARSKTGKPTAKEVEDVVAERQESKTSKFICRHCYGNELSDDGECCERCKEPVQPPKKAPPFNVTAATERLFDSLDDLLATWPANRHAEFFAACITYGNERKDA